MGAFWQIIPTYPATAGFQAPNQCTGAGQGWEAAGFSMDTPRKNRLKKKPWGFLSPSEDALDGFGGFSWLESHPGEETGLSPSWIYNLWVGVN